MNTDKIIRELAKTGKYQTIYTHTKEAGFPLFKNTSDYTENQVLFLNYLNFYYNLYTDVALEYVSEKVLDDFIYEDAYIVYKRKKKNGFYDTKADTKKDEAESTNSFTWVMKRPKKEGNK